MKQLKGYIVNNDRNIVFAIIKPGFLNISGEIIKIITSKEFELIKIKSKLLTINEAKYLYKIHKDEKWYNDLCKYMASGVSIGLLFKYNKSGNPFKTLENIKNDIREKYGESDMRNVLHSSDSYENMLIEQSVYF